jgi:hypothetical protein
VGDLPGSPGRSGVLFEHFREVVDSLRRERCNAVAQFGKTAWQDEAHSPSC